MGIYQPDKQYRAKRWCLWPVLNPVRITLHVCVCVVCAFIYLGVLQGVVANVKP